MVLQGTEVKAIREGKIQLKDSFVELRDGEAFLVGAHVSPYRHGNRENHDPERRRKLLLKRRELDRLFGQVQTKGLTVVPLSVYLKNKHIKLEIALAQGKKLHDKRAAERLREQQREIDEALSRRRKGVH